MDTNDYEILECENARLQDEAWQYLQEMEHMREYAKTLEQGIRYLKGELAKMARLNADLKGDAKNEPAE